MILAIDGTLRKMIRIVLQEKGMLLGMQLDNVVSQAPRRMEGSRTQEAVPLSVLEGGHFREAVAINDSFPVS